mmetsp:Transcript_30788/g.99598  ORF Transcript_30788/g.99598 Transcript_30788/m.99598 type:complete len:225 (+) Transcript_30788:116-790(+)
MARSFLACCAASRPRQPCLRGGSPRPQPASRPSSWRTASTAGAITRPTCSPGGSTTVSATSRTSTRLRPRSGAAWTLPTPLAPPSGPARRMRSCRRTFLGCPPRRGQPCWTRLKPRCAGGGAWSSPPTPASAPSPENTSVCIQSCGNFPRTFCIPTLSGWCKGSAPARRPKMELQRWAGRRLCSASWRRVRTSFPSSHRASAGCCVKRSATSEVLGCREASPTP